MQTTTLEEREKREASEKWKEADKNKNIFFAEGCVCKAQYYALFFGIFFVFFKIIEQVFWYNNSASNNIDVMCFSFGIYFCSCSGFCIHKFFYRYLFYLSLFLDYNGMER